jgi:hypothetical protein
MSVPPVNLGVMAGTDQIDIELTERERTFIADALYAWSGPAGWKPLPIDALGLSDWDAFDALTDRLRAAVSQGDALTELDWARALFLTEITWASCLVGAGLDFEIVTGFSDAEAITVLRSLQRKIANWQRADLLFPGRGRPRPVEEWKQRSARRLDEVRKQFPS